MRKKVKYLAAAISITALASSQAALLGEYTFNDTSSGPLEERMAVAMQSSSVATGATLSQLGTNTIQQLNFKGFSAVPWPSDEDAFSFGGNAGQQIMFFHRSTNGVATAWGPGGQTTAAHSPLSFTLAADASHTIIVSNILVGATGAWVSKTLWAFQEENAAQGAFIQVPGTLGSVTVGLSNAVVVAAGTSKTFTISMDSYKHYATQSIDYIKVNGSIVEGSIPEVDILELSLVATNLLKLVVGAAPDQAQYYHPECTTGLVSVPWAAVPHSDNGINPFVETNMAYSTIEGTNTVIYVQADATEKFFRVEK